MKKTIVATALAVCMSSSLVLAEEVVITEAIPELPTMEAAETSEKWNNMGLKVGTLGLGLEWAMPINEKFSVRFNLNGGSYDTKEDIDDVEHDLTIKLSTIGVLGDYYPSESAFRITAGAYINNTKFSDTATPTSSVPIEVGDKTYNINDIGNVDTEITFQTISPYIGIGYGNDVRKKGWGMTFDLGLMYQGAPTADVKANVKNPALAAEINGEIEAEKKKFEDDLADFDLYPVVMIGVNYTF